MELRVASHDRDLLVVEVPYAPEVGAYGLYYSDTSDAPGSFILADLMRPRSRGDVTHIPVAGSDLPINKERPFFIRLTKIIEGIETPIAQCEPLLVQPARPLYAMEQMLVPPASTFEQTVFNVTDFLGRASEDVSIISDKRVMVKINTLSASIEEISPKELQPLNVGLPVECLLMSNPWETEASVTIMSF